jgi:Fe-only nitrogenase accessory protein AnfO
MKVINLLQKIAISLDQSGYVRSMLEPGRIAVYKRNDVGWSVTESLTFMPSESIAGLRSAIGNLAQRLQDCRIIVSKKVEGIAYQELNRLGFSIFETNQISDEVLDGVLKDIDESEKNKAAFVPKAPYSTMQDGHFFLDLVKLQEAYPDISSKNAFRSFLESTAFLSFTLLCAHLPPWVHDVAVQRRLTIAQEHMPDGTVKALFLPVE